jgi:hypothetical protein
LRQIPSENPASGSFNKADGRWGHWLNRVMRHIDNESWTNAPEVHRLRAIGDEIRHVDGPNLEYRW